jgi:hypothetical protein
VHSRANCAVNGALLLAIECPLPRLNHEVSLTEIHTQDSKCNDLSAPLRNLFIECCVVEQWLSEIVVAHCVKYAGRDQKYAADLAGAH